MVRDFVNFVPNVNVIVIDWQRLAYFQYEIAAKQNVYLVGNYVAEVIKSWGLNLDTLTLVGHSLGGQVFGEVGKLCNGKVGRIIGRFS